MAKSRENGHSNSPIERFCSFPTRRDVRFESVRVLCGAAPQVLVIAGRIRALAGEYRCNYVAADRLPHIWEESPMAGKFELYKDKGGEVPLPPQGRQWPDHRCERGIRVKGERQQRHCFREEERPGRSSRRSDLIQTHNV